MCHKKGKILFAQNLYACFFFVIEVLSHSGLILKVIDTVGHEVLSDAKNVLYLIDRMQIVLKPPLEMYQFYKKSQLHITFKTIDFLGFEYHYLLTS